MSGFFSRHWHHHSRFYIAILLGAVAGVVCHSLKPPLPVGVAGDIFFLTYIGAMLAKIARLSPDDLREHAGVDDEGAALVALIALAVIGYSCVEIFVLLNQKTQPGIWPVLIVAAGAPLGWLMFHMMQAFHYAYLYYRRGENGEPQDPPPLDFPKTKEPGPWEFIYYSLVIGMTAQTSDVDVQCTPMRRVTSFHALISFFFNTVLIAMSVNAVVSRASGS